jgi:hypothetical protein
MSNEDLKPCPCCGQWPRTRLTQQNQTEFRCKTEGCPLSLGWCSVAAWNRRYVCPDKNGEAVFAGDGVRVLYGESRDLKGHVVWNKKHLRWTVVCGGKIVSFWQDQIELIESEGNND